MKFFRKIFKEASTDMGGRAEMPITEANYVVLDTELTGFDRKRDAIVSVGALKMVGGRIDMGRTFYQLVNPGRDMGTAAVVIHEITPSEILEKPAIDEVIKEFLEFCGDDILIGHYISIDLAFINREAVRVAGFAVPNPALDTLVMVDWLRWNIPNTDSDSLNPVNYQLYEIAKDLGIPVQGAHNALMDAFMTAQVLQRLLPKLERCGIRTLGQLLKVANPSRKLYQPGTLI
jgi:DNA polymerase-3 subunit epsilon